MLAQTIRLRGDARPQSLFGDIYRRCHSGRPLFDGLDVKRGGRELGVRYVLEGSARKASGRVRITVQLIEAATARWQEPMASGAPAVQSTLATISSSRLPRLMPGVPARLRRRVAVIEFVRPAAEPRGRI